MKVEIKEKNYKFYLSVNNSGTENSCIMLLQNTYVVSHAKVKLGGRFYVHLRVFNSL